ncbi:MAG: hypothetical protein HDT08_03455, partial [Bacteroidales bacterium]|nr:hypothetical protein [Bacteroidales bacterium]
RLFAEWAVAKLGDSHASNHFLSRGIEPGVIDSYRRMNYAIYKAQCRNAEVSPMSFEEFSKTPEAMNGFPYPTAEEVKQFTPYIDKLFGAMQEQKSDKGMMIYEPGAEYGEELNRNIEKGKRIDKLRNSTPVEITGEEIEYSSDIKQFKKNAIEFGKKLQGEYVNEDRGEVIQLQRGRKNGGLKEILQHDLSDSAHIKSVAAIPDIIRKSIYIDTEANHDKGKNPDVRGYEHYVCGLKIGGDDYTVHSIIAEDKAGNRYYDHKLSHIEKGKLLDFIESKQPLEQILTPMSGTEPTIRSERKVKELISLLQVEPVVKEGEGYWRSRQLGLFGEKEPEGEQQSLFGNVEPTTRIDMRADRDMADPEGEAANRAIDEYAERLWNELGSLESVESLGSLDAVEAIEERIHNATEELEGKLTEYYKSVGNLEHDAVQASRDMSRRVRAEVSVAMLKRRGELTDAPETSEVSEVSEKSEAKSSTIKTAGGDAVSFESMGSMRKLEEGEFTLVERKFSETGEFGFTGKERVESIDDVAYIFRALEDFSVENAFVALVKDGVPTVVHLGMGDATQTLVNMDAAYASMKAFGADEVYFVHNHPNGTLRPSAPDENMCRSIFQTYS